LVNASLAESGLCIERFMRIRMLTLLFTVIVHTLGISIASKFEEVIEEAKIIVGEPIIIENVPSGTVELASSVSRCFKDSRVRAVIIKNHGVVAIGKNLDEARSVVESLEEWAKVLTVCKIFNL